MKKIKSNVKGITLISLVITIVVLLILASIATYSGIEVIKSSNLTKFTTEMKIMQTQVNELYQKYKDNETIEIGGTKYCGKNAEESESTLTILDIGEEITNNQQAIFTSNESGITDSEGYKYWDINLIKELGIEGIKGEFFINIAKRSVVSCEGFKYEDTTYYTLEQLPNGLYNVEYNENINTGAPTFETSVDEISENKWRISISDIKYKGYINKWEVKYRLEGQTYWNTSDELSFVVEQTGKYYIEIINGNVKSEEKNILLYKLITPTTLELNVGEEKQIEASTEPIIEEEKLIYSSSDESIATVDETGKVTAVAEGTVTITVTGKIVTDKTKSIIVKVTQILE